jgi:hypothetical protein
VANLLNVPVGTVRSRLSRGRDQLRRLMGMEERASRKNSVKSDPQSGARIQPRSTGAPPD